MLELEKDLLRKFDNLKKFLEVWGKFVDVKIIELLKENSFTHEIKIYPSYRMKDDKSFLSKALWRGKPYENPLQEIEDKIGTRIVLLKTEDIAPVSEVLLQYSGWRSKITKNLKDPIEGKPREFDYQSFHIVVWPLESDERFEDAETSLLTCEIQIRTLLQHAFAEISHDSTYKGPYRNDTEIIRTLSKSMALMEATDDYFVHIFKMMTDSTKKFKCYIDELTDLFRKYNPAYDKRDLDIELTDILFGLLVKKDVSIIDVTELTKKETEKIAEALSENKTVLFQQPIVLLIYYYIIKHRKFFKENWPLSQESLKETLKGFGYSSE